MFCVKGRTDFIPFFKFLIMKKISILLFSVILLGAAGCKKSSSDTNTNTTNTSVDVTSVRSALIVGQWKVTYFVSNGINQTSNYTQYKLSFNSNGLLIGENSILSENGAWTLRNDSGKTKLGIDFTSAPMFAELTGDWEITSRSATRIVMQDVSGGSGQTDYLTIEKV